MATIASLVVDLVANTSQFRRDLERSQSLAGRASREISSSISGVNASVGAAIRSMTSFHAIIGTVVGTAGLGLLVRQSLAAADEIEEMAQRMGLGVEALQELQAGARLSGTSAEELEMGLRLLNDRIANAAQGNKEAAALFAQMGIAVRDSGGRIRNTTSILDDFADRLAATTDPAERTRLAIDAFGRSGTKLLPLLQDGSKGLAGMREEAQRLGLVLGADLVREAAKVNDEIDRLTATIRITLQRAILEFVANDTFREWLRDVGAGFVTFITQIKEGAQAFGLFPQSNVDRIADLRKQIAGLERELGDMDFLSRLFGHEDRYKARIATLKKDLDSLLERQREIARGRSLQAQPAGPAKPILFMEDLPTATGVLAEMQFGLADLGLTMTALDPLVAAFRAQVDLSAASMEDLTGTLMPVTRLMDDVGTAIGDATADLTDWDSLAKTAFEQTRTPLEKFTADADQLDQLLAKGLITLETHGRGVDKLVKDYNEASKGVDDLIISLRAERDLLSVTDRERRVQNELIRAGTELTKEQADSIRALVEEIHDWEQMKKLAEDQNRELKDGMKDLEDGAKDFGHAIGTAFEDAILKGEKFGGVLEALLQDIARIGLRMAVTKPLEGLIGAGLGAVVGAFAGPSTVPSSSIHSAAEGGVFTRPSLTTIAEHGAEAAIPLDRWGELGGGDVTVIVNNNAAPDTQARAREGRGPNGERMVEVLVEKAVKDLTARGAFDSMNATNYGLRRRGAGR